MSNACRNKSTNKNPIFKEYGKGLVLLHGTLEISIDEAKDLPDMESFLAKLADKKDVTDGFVDVLLGTTRLVRTRVIDNDLNPKFNEKFRIDVCHFANELVFEVKDKDHARSEYIGSVIISTSSLLDGTPTEGWFDITKKNRKVKGSIYLRVAYKSKESLDDTYEVNCYFPMRQNCHVTLYQDACVPSNLPQFAALPVYPSSCWHDVYTSIMGAQHFICITGWAVWDKLQLFRGEDLAIDKRTLGEILVDKAKEGVKVWVMVWSEKTSTHLTGSSTSFMGTNDIDTYNYFKDTGVNCCLAPRELKDSKELTDTLQNQFASASYTHHQKTIICDTQGCAGPKPRLVAFVGGLDLQTGRYDTPNFELFKTLLNEHQGDFRNKNVKVDPLQGPREPWHDIHSKVEGRVAFDVFCNFYERWDRQGDSKGFEELQKFLQSGIDINGSLNMDPGRTWNCQVFRSITDDSANFLDRKRINLMNTKKGRIVDSSIAQAYVQMIRNAKYFIYIENQYFLGSAYAWLKDTDVNCNHTIPAEIAQKVVEKIQANESFCAYIMIPMFSEGDPSSAPMQEILYWQTRTIEMMYKRVGDAIKASGSQTHPTDWLIFLCPAKREAAGEHLDRLDPPSEPMAKIFRETLRFPIYVHCKMMIVDDAYIIVGSANINERAMAGTRDSEIAVGCWQPTFTAENPSGDVHNFRISLWANHFMHVDPAFTYPGTQDCISKVKAMADENWKIYMGPVGSVMKGKVVTYPLKIDADGSIDTLDEAPTFPDFPPGSNVTGQRSTMIPQKVTT